MRFDNRITEYGLAAKFFRIAVFAFLFFAHFVSHAAPLSNARALGLAGAYSAVGSGAESPWTNPANLSFDKAHPFNLTFLGVGIGVSNSAFSVAEYNRYNGAYLGKQYKKDILKSIPSSGLVIDSRGELGIVGIGIRRFAFGVSLINAGYANIAKDLFELALTGNELNRTYAFNPIRGDALSALCFAVSYGAPVRTSLKNISRLGLGMTLKYYHGFGFAEMVHSHASSLTEYSSAAMDGDLELRTAQGGDGVGLDLGVAAGLYENYSISITLKNALNTIQWSKKTQRMDASFSLYTTGIEEIVTGKGEVDSILVSDDTTRNVARFSSRLPFVLNIGVAREIGRFELALEWKQGFKNSALSSRTPEFAFGCEYKLSKIIRLRLGQGIGGKKGYLFAYGIGLRFGSFQWDMAGCSMRGMPWNPAGIGLATQFSVGL